MIVGSERRNGMLRRRVYYLGCFLFIALSVACAEPTIHMSDEMPPTFSFTGSRFAEQKYVEFFVVTETTPDGQELSGNSSSSNEVKALWWIWPNDSKHGRLENLPVITYGKVPLGWHQQIPRQGEPPPLVEGRFYRAGGPAISVSEASMRFTIRNGKPVRLPR